MSLASSMLWRRMPSPSVTPNELLEILTAHTNGYYVLPEEPYDEVFPGIVLGDSTTALCLHLLRRLGITHVLNAAWGKHRNLGMVNTSPGYYRNSAIEFYGIEALDVAVFPLFEHFYPAVEFIADAVDQGGKVLVHCGEGISRSSTLVLAYLMIKRGFRVQEAVRQVVKHRNILPNQGFLLQLCQLHDRLQAQSGSSGIGISVSSPAPVSGTPSTTGRNSTSELRTNSNGGNQLQRQTSQPQHHPHPHPPPPHHHHHHHHNNHHLAITDNYGSERARSMSPSPYKSSRQSVSPLPERRPISQPLASSTGSRLPPLPSSSVLSSSTTIASPITSRSSYLENITNNSKYRHITGSVGGSGGGSGSSLSSNPLERTVRASSMIRERCPSPILSTRSKWSNNWTPPTLTSSIMSRPSSPILSSRYRRALSPCRSEIPSSSSSFSIRSRRCDSVDRMHTAGSYTSDSYLNHSNRMYSTSLLSTFTSRPLTIR